MAQSIMNKDVRKNCVNVESILMESILEPKSKNFGNSEEIVKSRELNKKNEALSSNYNAKMHQELVSINHVRQNLVYKNFYEYNR